MDGVTRVRIGDMICERSERCNDPQESEFDRFIGLEHMDTGRLEVTRWGSTDDITTAQKICRAGDILFARRNPYLRRASVIRFDAVCSGDCIVFYPLKDKVVPDYIPIVLGSKAFWEYAMKKQGGTMSKRVRFEGFSDYTFDLPSRQEQERIVRLVWSLEKLSKEINNQIQDLDLLIKSRFIEMFGTMSNPRYGPVQIGELVSKRITKVAKTFESDEIIQYIDIASIDKDSKAISETTEYMVKDAPSRAQQCIGRGDILLSNVRPNLKTMAIVDCDGDNLVCSSGFTVLRCEKCLPEYLIVAIASDVFTENLMKNATGSSYPAVTTKDVMSQQIQRGPDDLQKEFADFVKQVDKSKSSLQKYLEDTISFQRSIINGERP